MELPMDMIVEIAKKDYMAYVKLCLVDKRVGLNKELKRKMEEYHKKEIEKDISDECDECECKRMRKYKLLGEDIHGIHEESINGKVVERTLYDHGDKIWTHIYDIHGKQTQCIEYYILGFKYHAALMYNWEGKYYTIDSSSGWEINLDYEDLVIDIDYEDGTNEIVKCTKGNYEKFILRELK